jgi:hypothetical protein
MINIPLSVFGNFMHAIFFTRSNIAHAVGVLSKIYVKTKEGALDNNKEGFQVFSVALLVMDCATKED